MKLHKKFEHGLQGVGYWGERSEVDLRVNFGIFKAGETFSEDPIHYHRTRTTYFCVLEGSLGVEVEGKKITVTKDAMLEIPPMEKYRTVSVGAEGCKFVVIGNFSEDDRVFPE